MALYMLSVVCVAWWHAEGCQAEHFYYLLLCLCIMAEVVSPFSYRDWLTRSQLMWHVNNLSAVWRIEGCQKGSRFISQIALKSSIDKSPTAYIAITIRIPEHIDRPQCFKHIAPRAYPCKRSVWISKLQRPYMFREIYNSFVIRSPVLCA